MRHPSVSRRHAELTLTRTQLVIRDLKSSNGTFVDGRLVTTAMLRVGQEVRFGEIALMVGNEEQELPDATTRRYIRRQEATPAPHDTNGNGHTHILSPAASLIERSKSLTGAQSRVLHWLVRGLSEKEIASRLKLSPRTVHNHIQAIYERLGTHGRSQLMAEFLESRQDDSKGT